MSKTESSSTVGTNDAPEEAKLEGISLFHMALAFLKIGIIGFGGGMAVIALMEQECVRRRHCVDSEEFLHGVGLGQILGPFAVNAAIFVGSRLYGPLGGLIAAFSFLLPSMVLVVFLSWLYATFRHIPSLQSALAGLGPVVIALILSAAWSMGRKTLRSTLAIVIAALTCAADVLNVSPVLTLLMAGLAGLGLKLGASPLDKPPSLQSQHAILPFWPGLAAALQKTLPPAHGPIPIPDPVPVGAAAILSGSIGLLNLGWLFLKVGLVFFGGGFVLIPVLNHQLVEKLGWLTTQQFMDGVAISQLTPGPIAILATFAGFLKAGVPGALVATGALFAPSTVLMLLIASFYDRLHGRRFAKDFLAGVEPAVIGLVVAAAFALGPSSISLGRPVSVGLGLLSLVLLVRFQWPPAFVLLIGAAAGIAGPGFFH